MPNTTTKPATFFTVPAGTRASRCNGSTCGKPIYFVQNAKSGRMMPIDCAVPGGQRPSEHAPDPTQESLFGDKVEHHHGRGVLHFLTCSDADEFSKGRR
jgi:hypothetical protein